MLSHEVSLVEAFSQSSKNLIKNLTKKRLRRRETTGQKKGGEKT